MEEALQVGGRSVIERLTSLHCIRDVAILSRLDTRSGNAEQWKPPTERFSKTGEAG
jgi:hypothetical protein